MTERSRTKARPITPTPKATARFWSHVEEGEGCWLWTGEISGSSGRPKYTSGYGRLHMSYRPWVRVFAHRYSWVLHFGPIPEGLWVLHRCSTLYAAGDITYRRCVNPSHLFLGTCQDGARHAVANGRYPVGDRNGTRLCPESLPRGPQHHYNARPETRPRGELNPRAKLRAEDVLKIRELFAAGVTTQTTLARSYGVSQAVISSITRGKTWRHLGERSTP
jgi:hypothetical protein